LLAATPAAMGQSESEVPTELWGNVVLDFPKGDRWLFETDFEPKTLVSGERSGGTSISPPLVEYYPNRWVDFVGETTVGYTHQTTRSTASSSRRASASG
jgi:hypothetical protein